MNDSGKVQITGTVISGLGKGKHFIQLPLYNEIFSQLIGQPPFPGTLNLKVSLEDGRKIERFYHDKGRRYIDLEFNGQKFGDIEVLHAKMTDGNQSIPIVLVRPLLSEHDLTVVEVVASVQLRQHFNLSDGDKITLEIDIEKKAE